MSRVVLPKIPHHVTQRGVRSMNIFFDEGDQKLYLRLMKEQGERAGLEFLSYCLMDNHVHLIVIPKHESSLRQGIGEAHRLYTRSVNIRQNTRGYLFQGRFYSCPLDRVHLGEAARYVERNPVRANMCRKAEEYRWSSARFHTGKIRTDPLVSSSSWYGTASDWKRFLKEDSVELDQMRMAFRTGRPFGNDKFIKKAEKITGRVLKPKPPGRPKTSGK
ncbi:MAG: transposase [SAR324 cluster bacterium]|nr:transposase [SAR324 cluster bacterium]